MWGKKKEAEKPSVVNLACVYNCIGKKCPKWVELNSGEKLVGRCAEAWIPVLLVELRQEIQNGNINKNNTSPS